MSPLCYNYEMPWEPLKTTFDTPRELNDMAGTGGKMRFLLDNNVDSDYLIAFLDGAGLGAHDLPYGMEDASDEDVLAYAYKHDRVLLTHDEDFLNEQRFPFENSCGVVILPGGSGEVRRHADTIRRMLQLMKPWPGLWLQTTVRILSNGVISIKGVNATTGKPIDRWFLRFDANGRAEYWANEDHDPE